MDIKKEAWLAKHSGLGLLQTQCLQDLFEEFKVPFSNQDVYIEHFPVPQRRIDIPEEADSSEEQDLRSFLLQTLDYFSEVVDGDEVLGGLCVKRDIFIQFVLPTT